MYLTRPGVCVWVSQNNNDRVHHQRTLKSTPIVALASSSGINCLSEKRRRRLLFPTDEFPISRSLTLISSCGRGCGGIGAIVRGVYVVRVCWCQGVVLGNKWRENGTRERVANVWRRVSSWISGIGTYGWLVEVEEETPDQVYSFTASQGPRRS